jgi:transforming growth factor-beta-induced protein
MLVKTAIATLLAATAVLAQNNSIASVAQQQSELSALVNALNGTQLLDQLKGNATQGNFTVFAPSNSALTAALSALPANINATDILRYHVINGTHPASSFQKGSNFFNSFLTNDTLDHFPSGVGLPLNVVNDGKNVAVYYGVKNATVTTPDMKADNGIIHIIDGFLLPPSDVNITGTLLGLDKFVSALNATNSTDPVVKKKGITVFAPSNSAFDNTDLSKFNSSQLAHIIAYHIVEGVYYSTNLTSSVNVTTTEGHNLTIYTNPIQLVDASGNHTASVKRADVLLANGVLHVIDTVLFPTVNKSDIPTNGTKLSAGVSFKGAEFSITAMFLTAVSAVFVSML